MIKRINIRLPGSVISCMVNNGSEPTIVFLHGNSLSSDSFSKQFSDQELQRFRIIAIDLPGHGESTRSLTPATEYNLFHFRDVVIQVLEQLEVSSFIFAGHSLGGHVAMECLPYTKDCQGIFLWGAPPVTLPLDTSKLFLPDPRAALLFTPDLTDEEVNNLSTLLTLPEYQHEIVKMLTVSDPAFRQHLAISLGQGKISDELNLINSENIAVAILHSEKDNLINSDYYNSLNSKSLWGGEPIIVQNSAHTLQLENPQLFNKLLFDFCSTIFS